MSEQKREQGARMPLPFGSDKDAIRQLEQERKQREKKTIALIDNINEQETVNQATAKMNRCTSLDAEATALLRTNWYGHIDKIVARAREIDAVQNEQTRAEQARIQREVAEKEAALTPLDKFAPLHAHRNLPSFRLKREAWVEQQTKETIDVMISDLKKGKLPSGIAFTPEDVDTAITFLSIAANEKTTNQQPKPESLAQKFGKFAHLP
jgi:hypothetical protein